MTAIQSENEHKLKQKILIEILTYFVENNGNFPDSEIFLLKHREYEVLIEDMKKQGLIWFEKYQFRDGIMLKVAGLLQIEDEVAKTIITNGNTLIRNLQKMLREDPTLVKKDTTLVDISRKIRKKLFDVEIAFYFLKDIEYLGFKFTGGSTGKADSQLTSSIKLKGGIFSYNSMEEAVEKLNNRMGKEPNNPNSTLTADLLEKQIIAPIKHNPKLLRTTFSSYLLIEPIGEGGSGKVYKAKVNGSEKLVAIKVLDSKKASSEKLKRFKNEYIFCSRNKHPNIITVVDHGLTVDESPFFVMPLYKHSLRKTIGNISSIDAFKLYLEVLNGVDAAHKQNVIHRDLKPENILVGEDSSIVVTDFGIAEFSEEDIYTEVETKIGTRLANFQYAAPEQKSRGKTVGKAADIYALGLILNELFTNEIAHGTNYKNIAAVSKEYSYLDKFVEKMLEQSPSQRFSDIDEIKKELAIRSGEQISLQKISELKETVIPVNEIDDQIAIDPIKIVGVDWENNVLRLDLSHAPNETWIWSLQNMGNYTSVMYKGPEKFNFRGKVASISADKHDAQRIIDYFKEWMPIVDRVYKNKLKTDAEREEAQKREQLANKIRLEQDKMNFKNSLKF